MKEPFVVTESGLEDIAEGVINTLAAQDSSRAKVLFLEGDLGAGKTTFTKALAAILGITKEDVHSPTFILKKEYKGDHPSFKKLVHVDAYRFDVPEEAAVLKLERDLEDKETLMERSRILEDIGPKALFEQHMKKMQSLEKITF